MTVICDRNGSIHLLLYLFKKLPIIIDEALCSGDGGEEDDGLWADCGRVVMPGPLCQPGLISVSPRPPSREVTHNTEPHQRSPSGVITQLGTEF